MIRGTERVKKCIMIQQGVQPRMGSNNNDHNEWNINNDEHSVEVVFFLCVCVFG